MLLPWHAVIFPSHTQIQCDGTGDLPIVFEERTHFILMIGADFARRKTIGRFLCLLHLGPLFESESRRTVEEETLIDIADRTRQVD